MKPKLLSKISLFLALIVMLASIPETNVFAATDTGTGAVSEDVYTEDDTPSDIPFSASDEQYGSSAPEYAIPADTVPNSETDEMPDAAFPEASDQIDGGTDTEITGEIAFGDDTDAEPAGEISDESYLTDDTDSENVYDASEEASITDDADPEAVSGINSEVSLEDIIDGEESVGENESLGYIYPFETKYTFTFIAIKGGERVVLEYENTATSDTHLEDFLTADQLQNIYMMRGTSNELIGWNVYKDGRYDKYVANDTANNLTVFNNYLFNPRCDYCIVADEAHFVPEDGGFSIEVIPAVEYTGKSHVSRSQDLNRSQSKTAVADLDLYVYCKGEVGTDLLRYGKDYKVTYKNNKNASMKLVYDEITEAVRYVPKYTSEKDNSKRPQAVITGIGNFIGVKSTVYFDILPYNFGNPASENDPLPVVSGLKHSYRLSSGKIRDFTSKASIRLNGSKSITLKKNTDYIQKFYKYESGMWIEYPSVNETGKWLYTIQGIGNYCGTYFGQSKGEYFNDGSQPGSLTPVAAAYDSASYMPDQFLVYGGNTLDLSKAKITVKKTSKNYVYKKTYGPDDFGIKVTLDGYPLKPGKDIDIVFDGADYTYPIGMEKASGAYVFTTDKSEFVNSVWMANKYKLCIEAKPGNPDGYFGTLKSSKTVTVKGRKIKAKYYKFKTSKLKYNGKYSGGDDLVEYSGSPVTALEPNTVRYMLDDNTTEVTIDGKQYYQFNYLKTIFDMHTEDGLPYNSNQLQYGIMPTVTRAKTPGKYAATLYPFSPGVDHSYSAKTTYTRKKISLKEAWDKGLVKVTCSGECFYNAGVSIPREVIIHMSDKDSLGAHSNSKPFYLRFNGQTLSSDFTKPYVFTDGDSFDPARETFTISVTNDLKHNIGYLTIKCKGNAYSGTLKKKVKFNIKPREVSGTIPVITNDRLSTHYAMVRGSRTSTIKVASKDDAGNLYAVVNAQKAGPGGQIPTNPSITLYQSYFANMTELRENRVRLKKIDPKKYKLAYSGPPRNYTVKITEKYTDHYKSMFDFSASPELDKTYDLYLETVTISKITGTYGSQTYDLLKNKKVTLPYRGEQVLFDSITIKVKDKNGTEMDYDVNNLDIVYGDNIAAGKNKGTVTLYPKKGFFGSFEYGFKPKTIKFNISAAPNDVL